MLTQFNSVWAAICKQAHRQHSCYSDVEYSKITAVMKVEYNCLLVAAKVVQAGQRLLMHAPLTRQWYLKVSVRRLVLLKVYQ